MSYNLSYQSIIGNFLLDFQLYTEIKLETNVFFSIHSKLYSVIMADNDLTKKHSAGYIGVFGSRIDTIVNEIAAGADITIVPSSPYHTTLITKDEHYIN